MFKEFEWGGRKLEEKKSERSEPPHNQSLHFFLFHCPRLMYGQVIEKAGDNEVKEITSEAQQANLLVVTLLNYSLHSSFICFPILANEWTRNWWARIRET